VRLVRPANEGHPEKASLGLGLFVVSQIAKAHEGTIQAESVAPDKCAVRGLRGRDGQLLADCAGLELHGATLSPTSRDP